MIIDLTELMTNNKEVLNLSFSVSYDEDKFVNTSIKELRDTIFKGKIRKIYDDDYEIEGNLSGVMVLPDDITLDDVLYEFSIDVMENFSEYDNEENNLVIFQNKLDISDYLWQNILVEVPLKVVSEKSKNIKLKGNGWRFITESELQDNNKSPFDELDNKFD